MVRLPWHLKIEVDTADPIGRAIADEGVYDITTTELLWRLTDPGDLCIDAGANIGYITSIFVARSGPSGEVHAYEPHPGTFDLLGKNTYRWTQKVGTKIILHKFGLSNAAGTAVLDNPTNGERYPSQASLSAASGDSGFRAKTERLEFMIETFIPGNRRVGVLRMHLPSHAAEALEGLGPHLLYGKIRDIVYEEESGYPAKSHDVLREAGYHILAFEEHPQGVRIVSSSLPIEKRSYDIFPGFLATLDPARAIRRLDSEGWHSLIGKS